jgi:DNA replication protein DnaC
MRTKTQWKDRIRETFLKQFSPRIQQDLKLIPEPENLPETVQSSFITGEAGTGKTIYSCWLMLREQRNLYLQAMNADCEFISVPVLLQKIKASFDTPEVSEHQILEHYSTVHLLVLDDLGTNKSTDWAFQTLYLIINNRYENLKKTIITSNLTLEQLSKVLGDDRITSRIERMCEIIIKDNWK